MAKLLADIGIAESVKHKSILGANGVRTCQKVATQDAELAVSMISEILSVDGVDFLGPLPRKVQKVTDYWAALTNNAQDVVAATDFIALLRDFVRHPKYAKLGLNYEERG